MRAFPLCRVHRKLGGWQREDQPAAAGVDRRELQDVAKERPVGISVLAVDDDVCTADHPSPHLCPDNRALRHIYAPSARKPMKNARRKTCSAVRCLTICPTYIPT